MLAAFWLLAGSAAAYEPPPIEAFAMRPIIGEADLSPDGAHLAIRRLLGRGQHYAVFVYETEDLQAKPYTIGSEHMDIMRVRWANDERLLLTVRQPVEIPGRRAGYASTSIGAPGRVKTYAYKLLSVGLEGGKFVELPRKGGIARSLSETFTNRLASPRVVDRLAKEDDWILVEWASDFADRSDLLRVNVHDGRMEPVFRQSENYFGYDLDGDKQVRLRSKIDRGEDTITVQYRLAGESEWRDFYSYEWENRAPERAFLDFAKIAREGGEESTNFAYVRSSIGRDTAGIYLHDLERPDQPGELYFALDGFDAQNILKKGTGDDD
ncbi:MAG: hypothetical protein J4G09_04130 [Proteobacteria bacterium]|nr:hypothetical protein [Pseudomonadota bacterium]